MSVQPMNVKPMGVRQGIVLAAGRGTRLWPLSKAFAKQLLPVYDKPLVYYAVSSLMLAGIRDILLIVNPRDRGLFGELLGDGSDWGMRFRYALQDQPRGVADAFLVASQHLPVEPVALVLGDNIFYGNGFTDLLRRVAGRTEGATLFTFPVKDPERYGVAVLDAGGQPRELVEKPRQPSSNLAITGLYFYDAEVFSRAAQLRPSARGELEITDLNRSYLDTSNLRIERLGRGFMWFDAGTPESYMEAGAYVQSVETRQGLKIGCPEEIAWRMGWIDDHQLRRLAGSSPGPYGAYLGRLLEAAC